MGKQWIVPTFLLSGIVVGLLGFAQPDAEAFDSLPPIQEISHRHTVENQVNRSQEPADVFLPLIQLRDDDFPQTPTAEPTAPSDISPTPTATSVTSTATTTPTTEPTPTNTPSTETEFPILFVSQLPIRPDFTTIGSTFGNHLATLHSVGRGGDLWIRYTDGELRNLTQLAGYGSMNEDGFQDANAIAVRDPDVHWDGNKVLFSMVVGAPTQQFQVNNYYWQMYEVAGLGQSDTPVISKIANQPEDFNNVSPIYASEDRIIFTTDRPRNGARHLYPQLDEYEEAPTNTGLWRLDPVTGNLDLLNHAPSGNFTPLIDSFGRVLFTQWDHLQRDQQADADNATAPGDPLPYGTFNYSDESVDAEILDDRTEVFPEQRRNAPDRPEHVVGLRFNHFFPWEIREDGTESEVLNHLGRHELHDYFAQSINTDANLIEFIPGSQGPNARPNENSIENFFHIAEDPLHPGLYYGIDAPEFNTHSAGMIVSLYAPPLANADGVTITYVTHPDTIGNNATPNHSGHYREPLPLSNGDLVAVHTSQTSDEATSGDSVYDFRLTDLTRNRNGYWAADTTLTSGISKTVSYWDPDQFVTYSGYFWELNPVEVRPRTRPNVSEPDLEEPEANAFTMAGVNIEDVRQYLRQNNLALLVTRNVTTRDDLDRQQPFNLQVITTDGTEGVQSIGADGTLYDVTYMQFFQGDQIRGLTRGSDTPRPGRRVLAQVLHADTALAANPTSAGPPGSVAIAEDGSMAAFVPAQRALSWQLTDNTGNPIVRERYWLTFQPGEIRTCTSCHGVNQADQAGDGPSENSPAALLSLLEYWQENQ
ncbi:MAG: hypothetical protein AAF702_44800 [Chloroflexota bacterium]